MAVDQSAHVCGRMAIVTARANTHTNVRMATEASPNTGEYRVRPSTLEGVRVQDPPFTAATGAYNYRTFDESSDVWSESDSYRERRDEILAAYRLGSHDPRLWQVNVPAGDSRQDVQLVRCEACGQSSNLAWLVQGLPRRSMRKRRPHDFKGRRVKNTPNVCKPVSSEDMAVEIKRRHTSDGLAIRALLGVLFAILAISLLVRDAAAPSSKQVWAYFGFFLLGTVSAIIWVSFIRIYRSTRK